jgi:phospholipid/cholesterol/gamma-HCH transport system substrate-binding protein
MRRTRQRGMSYTTAGLLAIAVAVAGTYLGFTKSIPFRSHYEVDAVFRSASTLSPDSPVRIAGVDVGKVTAVEPVGDGAEAARVTLRIRKQGMPIHKDARLKIRPRIFLEGNFFVDVEPGSPSLPELSDGETIPVNQTAAPVQLGAILESLQSDTREDLRVLLHELSEGLKGEGAAGFRRSIRYWEPAYKNSALVNDASLGETGRDLSGYVRNAGRVAAALGRNREQLKALVTDFRVTAGAFAARDERLSDAIGELPRTLRAGMPALARLDAALPSVRAFARDLRPGVRSSGPTLDAALPFVRQLRRLVQPSELRGLAADLRPTVPSLARLNRETVPLLERVRAASSCQNEVILPWTRDKIEDPDFPAIGPVYQEQTKPLVGLAGESRSGDANGQWFRVSLAGAQYAYDTGAERFLFTDRPLRGVNPPPPPAGYRSPLRPHVPCETQEGPDLRTRQMEVGSRGIRVDQSSPAAVERAEKALKTTLDWLEGEVGKEGLKLDVGKQLLDGADLPRTPRLGG